MITEEQRLNRSEAIYGSDVAAICGAYPADAKWAQKLTPLHIWQIKKGYIEPDDISDEPRVKAGNYMEPAIRTWFEDDSGLKVHCPEHTLVHPQYSWLRGHVDGLTVTEDGKKAVVEIKTADVRQSKYWDTELAFIPTQYLMQITHYMAITDSDMAFVVVLIGGNDYRVYKFERNKKLEDRVIEKLKRFWEYNILKDIPPEPANLDDIKLLFPESDGKIAIAGNAVCLHFAELIDIREKMNELESRSDAIKKSICEVMGTAETIVDGFGEVLATWKTSKPATRIDGAALKAALPDIYKQYSKTDKIGSRPFKVKE